MTLTRRTRHAGHQILFFICFVIHDSPPSCHPLSAPRSGKVVSTRVSRSNGSCGKGAARASAALSLSFPIPLSKNPSQRFCLLSYERKQQKSVCHQFAQSPASSHFTRNDAAPFYFINFSSIAQSSSTLSSLPSRISSATQPRIWAARRSLLKLFSAFDTAETCITMSGQ